MRRIARSGWIFWSCCLFALAAVGCGRGSNPAQTKPSAIKIFYFEEAAMGPSWDMSGKFLVFEPLVRRNPKGEFESRLAERWEHTPDYRTWTVYLRKNVLWHDGVPFTAHDVQFTLDLLSRPKVLQVLPGSYSMTVLNDYTFRVTLHQQTIGSPLDNWTVYYPKHLLEKMDPKDFYDWEFWKSPVGNGPYRYLRYIPKTMMEFEANPNYYRGKPKIDRVVLKFGQLSLTELLSGNVDILPYLEPMNALKLGSDPRFKVYRFVGSGEGGIPKAIVWNQHHPPFGDAKVRRALTLAINRSELHQVLNLPKGMPIFDVLFSARQFLRGELPQPLPYDPQQAKRLLEETGWKDTDGDGVRDQDNKRFHFTLLTTNAEGLDKPAIFIQAQLHQVGIQMDIQILDADSHGKRVDDGKFEAAIFRRFPGGRFGPIEYFGEDSPIGYDNSKVVALLQEARASVNPDEIDRIYRELMPIFQADLPMTFLQPAVAYTAAHQRVHGLSNSCIDPTECIEDLSLEDPGRTNKN